MKSLGTALKTAVLVAKASLGRNVSALAVGTALALMLSLAGCAESHGSIVDHDRDGYAADVDCDDDNPDVYPGAPEPFPTDCCELGPVIDYNCDGAPIACSCNPFPDDFDGDGYPSTTDCNDGDPTIYPGAPEDECDIGGPDRNCDGIPPGAICNPIPDYDADGDGWLFSDDCDDSDPNIHPEADEPPCADGADQDCDGADGWDDPTIRCAPPDADMDGYPSYYDCDDNEPRINPGVTEDICADGIDQDCDGVDGDPGVICNGMADVDPSDAQPA
jgi:hypothetical protein